VARGKKLTSSGVPLPIPIKEAGVTDELQATIDGCIAAHRRLEGTLGSIDDKVARQPSRLPGWTVGHVLTHLARNAESHVRILDAAMEGTSVEQYPGGYEQRSADIEAGSTRTSGELCDDVRATAAALEAAWDRMTPEAWHGHGLAHGTEWPCSMLPFHRWREVEMHHADLGLSYSPANWPEEYVALELPAALATFPDRLADSDARRVLVWLVGRSDQPAGVNLAPWQADREHYFVPPPDLETDRRRVTIFRSRLRQEAVQSYGSVAERIAEVARAMPGFVEIKTFTADDGERVSLVTFASAEEHEAWRVHPEHRAAQRRGREEFYQDYLIQVCQVTSERSFTRP
jgi:maleylpyruvate isomerase